MVEVKAYFVTGCKVSRTEIFTGYVLNIDNEPITESIKKKIGNKKLLCEETNEGFEYNKVDIRSVPVTGLSLGDLLLVFGRYDIPKLT